MGNMTCRAPTSATTCSGTPTGQQLTYDPEGMLSAWQDKPTSPTKVVNYLYDGEGMRVAQQYTSGGTTTTTAYIGEIEEASTTGGTTTTTTYYYAGSDRIALAVNGVFSYLGSDRLNSASVTLAATGTPTASQLYDPYGATRYSNGTMPTDIGFTGQKADAVTGLDYYVSRYYDPSVGQFISTDSALPSNGYNPWGLSRYAYVQGNPETLTDPDGHCWPLCTMIIGAVIGGAIGAATSVVTQAASGHGVNWGQVGKDAAVGAVSGAVAGLAGPEAGPIMMVCAWRYPFGVLWLVITVGGGKPFSVAVALWGVALDRRWRWRWFGGAGFDAAATEGIRSRADGGGDDGGGLHELVGAGDVDAERREDGNDSGQEGDPELAGGIAGLDHVMPPRRI